MQQVDRRIFKDGLLDSDSGSIYLGPNTWVNMRDFRIGTTGTVDGRTDYIQSIGSTVLKTNPNLPATGTNIIIGHAPDFPHKRIVYTLWNSLGNHGIFVYDLPTDTVYTVLLNSQVSGGLNFDKYHPIHSGFVINHCFYWTDNFNQPQRINIDAGIKLNQPSYTTTFAPYTAPLDISVTSWIRRQPGLPPTQVKAANALLVNNFISNEAFQFCYRYIYRDYETGTLSALSTLANFNPAGSTLNTINVSIPLQEQIQQDVIQVDLVARYLVSGIYFIINSWQTSVPADAAAIAAHNAGTTALTYAFINDAIGIALDTTYSEKPYDNVPLLAGTTEFAKSRGYLANYTAGYDTPQLTSLTATPVSGTISGSVVGEWYFFTFTTQAIGIGGIPTGPKTTHSLYMLQIEHITPVLNGYYSYNPGGVPPFPGVVDYSNVTFLGGGFTEVMNYYFPGNQNIIVNVVDQGAASTITSAPGGGGGDLIDPRVWKSDDSYRVSINFRDYWGRSDGVYFTSATSNVYIPDTVFNPSTYTTGIQWLLSNTNALNEIPPWAYYYSINITKSLRTRFFQEIDSNNVSYATIDPFTGEYSFTTNTYSMTNAGFAVDISAFVTYNQGYLFTAGDVCKVYKSDNSAPTSLPIIAQVNQYIVLQNFDFGVLNAPGPATEVKIEIYTPYKQQADEANWEVGQIFQVANPSTSGRQYSVTTGTIAGDVTLLSRNNGSAAYFVEAMSPNDLFYQQWNTDSGRPNFIDTIGQQTEPSTITWGSTFINGSKINGLSTFDALNTKDISPDYGTIQKLVLTNKIHLTGSIMLAICDAGETAALYMGENVIMTTTGQSQVVQTTDVIGYVNNLRGSYGTLNPESVVEFRGNVYWYDALNKKYIQYSDSGLFPISNYKLTRYWKLFSDTYNSLSPAAIEAFGSRPYVFSGIDPHNGELLVSVPQVLAAPPKGNLVDYPSVAYPGDFWDGEAKSLVYKIVAEPNKWTGAYRMPAEQFAYMESNTYAFKDGNIYLCNDTATFGNIFGVQQTPDICLYSNATPNRPKEYNNLVLQANAAPIFTHVASEYPTVQSSTIGPWTNLEGIWYAQILRDRLTLGYAGDYNSAMFRGGKMRTVALQVYFQFDCTTGLVQAKFMNATYSLSKGQVLA